MNSLVMIFITEPNGLIECTKSGQLCMLPESSIPGSKNQIKHKFASVDGGLHVIFNFSAGLHCLCGAHYRNVYKPMLANIELCFALQCIVRTAFWFQLIVDCSCHTVNSQIKAHVLVSPQERNMHLCMYV